MDSQIKITVEETSLNVNESIYSILDQNDMYENSEGLMRTSSLTSLDFLIKGERMVSELCNISAEFPANDANKSENTFNRRGYNIVGRQLKPTTQNISQHHKASQTINNSNQAWHKYGFEMYDETIPFQIIHLAVEACTVAENIAIANKYRPCFKNIQTICEKTRSNVQQPDSAVAQLHSQGVPWVMKNFIFAFVRILDGWKGIKELMCEKHESFARIEQKYYNPQIQQCFLEWQFVTKKMLDHIYRTFKSLDEGFKAEQQEFKRNPNYSLIQNRIKQQTKPQMKTSQYYETPIQWNNLCGQNISHEMQMAAKWSTNPAIANTLSSIKSSFEGGVQVDCNGAYRSNYISDICESKNLMTENDPKVINGMGDSSKAIFQQQSRNDLINNNHLLDVSQKAMWSSDFAATTSMTVKKILQNTGVRMLGGDPSLSPGHDNTMFCNQDRRLDSSVNYQLHRSCPNDSTIQGNLQSLNYFNSESILSSNSNWPNTAHNCNVRMSNNNMEPSSFCLQSKYDDNTVYMKPGRYNVPIKIIADSSCLSEEQATVKSMIILNSELATVQNMPKSATESTMSASQTSYIQQNNESNQNSPSYSSLDLKHSEIDPLCTIDEKWEAAKWSVSELISTMNIPGQSTVFDFSRKIRPVKNIKVIQTPRLLFSGEYCKNSNTANENNDDESSIQCSPSKCEHENSVPVKQSNKYIVEQNKMTSTGKQNTVMEKDCAQSDITKKFKKKNKLPTVKQFGKKKRYFDAIKRMEYILDSIVTMERSLGISTDVDIHQASHYQYVVKNPITFDQVSDKIYNSSYYNVDLLENDIRKIYSDAITYLEIYPESLLKLKIEKLSQYFEDLIAKDDFPDDGHSSKDNNVYCVKSIMKKPDLNHTKKIPFASESKTIQN